MNKVLEYFEDPSSILGKISIDNISSSFDISFLKLDAALVNFLLHLKNFRTFIIWVTVVPVAYFILLWLFRAIGYLPNPVRSGSRGSDIMAFEIVALGCVFYLSVAGVVGLFGLFDVKAFGADFKLSETWYMRSEFIENHLLIPMFSYQAWNLVLCLFNKDLYSAEMIIHHFFAAVSALIGLSPYFQWFALYFYGIVELTNIPLTAVDVFKIFPQYQEQFPGLNALARYSFAVSFFLVRLMTWPYFMYLLFDETYKVLMSDNPQKNPAITLYVVFIVFVLTFLQYFWGYRILYFLKKTNSKSGLSTKKID